MTGHRELFDDYEAVQQVGVLFTQSRQGGGGRYYRPLRHVCANLVELNVPFGMAVAGDELLVNRVTIPHVDLWGILEIDR